MATNTENGSGLGLNNWRIAAWATAGLILLLPLVAMQFTDEVNWTAGDFAFAAVLIVGTGVIFELAMRRAESLAYKAAVGIALAGIFLLIWINAAVGIIGSAANDANMMYGAVLAVALIGSAIARLQPRGMKNTMFATALAQTLVAAIALIAGLGASVNGPLEIIGLNGFFIALFVASALLFRRAALEPLI